MACLACFTRKLPWSRANILVRCPGRPTFPTQPGFVVSGSSDFPSSRPSDTRDSRISRTHCRVANLSMALGQAHPSSRPVLGLFHTLGILSETSPFGEKCERSSQLAQAFLPPFFQ